MDNPKLTLGATLWRPHTWAQIHARIRSQAKKEGIIAPWKGCYINGVPSLDKEFHHLALRGDLTNAAGVDLTARQRNLTKPARHDLTALTKGDYRIDVRECSEPIHEPTYVGGIP